MKGGVSVLSRIRKLTVSPAYLLLLLVVYDMRSLVVLCKEHWHRQTITEKRWISHQLKLTWHSKS